MKSPRSRRVRVRAALIVPALIVLLAAPSAAQISANASSVVDDWSFHRLLFSSPGTFADALRNGTTARWYQIVNDPRYQMQQKRLSLSPAVQAQTANPSAKKDWSEALTSTGVAATLTGVVGTLSSSTISSSSTLTVDGVTFKASPPTSETATIKFGSSGPANTSSVTIGSVTYVFETSSIGSAPSSGCQVYSAAGSTGATNLYDAITLTGTQAGTTYRCASSITTANSAVTVSLSSSTISLMAEIAGSTGFTFSDTGTTHFSTFSDTAGTDGATSSTAFAYWSGSNYVSSATLATNIATAVNDNATVNAVLKAAANTPASDDVTFTAKIAGVSGNGYQVTASDFSAFSPSSASLSGGAAGVQPNVFPAKFNFSTTSASCSDFVVYPTGAAGASNAANIVAYSNLYSGYCTTGSVPAVDWAYNTGGTVTTSPILSDGRFPGSVHPGQRRDGEPGYAQVGGDGRVNLRAHDAYRAGIGVRVPELRGSLLLRSEPGRERYTLIAILRLHPRCALRWRRQRQSPPVLRGF